MGPYFMNRIIILNMVGIIYPHSFCYVLCFLVLGLFLTLNLGITPGGAHGTLWDVRDKI